MKIAGKSDAIEVRNQCYELLKTSKKMPKDAVIKNTLKNGGIIRYKRGPDMIMLCVCDIFTTPYERRLEIKKIAEKIISKVIKSNPHLYITLSAYHELFNRR
jgi:hypothetical protein